MQKGGIKFMNITFLIGNGFDLNLNLKTSYKNFLNNYLIIKNKDEEITAFKRQISNKLNLWSNAELAFGKYTGLYNSSEIDIFEKCYNNFISELSNYLEKEQNRIKFKNEEDINIKISKTCSNIFNSFYSLKYLSRQSHITIKETINKFRSDEPYNYNFINFNYTDVFDRFINSMTKVSPVLTHINRNESKIYDKLHLPLHIHGKINDGMIFGVDNETQISNTYFSSDIIFKNYFIKSNAINEIGTLSNTMAKQLIDDSHIICVFGMSFGETDRVWWNTIKDWLFKDNNQLILYIHDPTINNCLVSSITQNKSNLFRKIFNMEFLDPKNEIRNRVHFSFNKNLFADLKQLVTISDKDKELLKTT